MHVVVVDVWAQGLETRLFCCAIPEETINRVIQTGLVRLPVLQLSRRDATTWQDSVSFRVFHSRQKYSLKALLMRI